MEDSRVTSGKLAAMVRYLYQGGYSPWAIAELSGLGMEAREVMDFLGAHLPDFQEKFIDGKRSAHG